MSFTTFRRSGVEVRTPVWLAARDGKLHIFTAGESGKVKRLRHSPRARVAPCDVRERIRGVWRGAISPIVAEPAIGRGGARGLAREVRRADAAGRPGLVCRR